MIHLRQISSWQQLLVLVLFCTFLLGCSPQQDKRLMLGTNPWIGYEPLYLARNMELLDPDTVRLLDFTSATEAIRAFGNGAINSASLTLDEALLLVQEGIDLKIVLVVDVSNGGDTILGQPEIRDLSELKGKRVGVEYSALGAYMLSRALQHIGLKKKDIQLVPLEINEHHRAFRERRIDAVVTFEPFSSQIMAAGATKLFDSSQIANEIIDVIVVRTDFLKTHPQTIRHLLQAWFLAVDYLKHHPQEAATKMMAHHNLREPQQIMDLFAGLKIPSFAENKTLLSAGQPGSLTESGKMLVELMLEENLLQTPADIEQLLYERWGEDLL